MARKSQYSSLGMPGAIRTFIAKTIESIPETLENIIRFNLFISQHKGFDLSIDQKKYVHLFIDKKKTFELEF